MSTLTPRLASSKTWTDIPQEFLEKVVSVFKNQFEIEAETGEFIADGRVYPQELVLRVGYLESGRLKQINFEASIDIRSANSAAPTPTAPQDGTAFSSDEESDKAQAKKTTMDRLYVCIDALGSAMEEYFQAGDDEETDMPVPRRWEEYDFEGESVFMQYSTVNTKLEEEADRILGLLANELVQVETPSEDALANAEVDSELAAEIQKAIRSGKFKLPDDFSEPEQQN